MSVCTSRKVLLPSERTHTIAVEGLQGPLHIIWIVDGHMLTHSDGEIEIAFDMRGRMVGETLTRQLSVQLSALAGPGLLCIVVYLSRSLLYPMKYRQ